MIETSSPTRVDLAGGTLDCWPLHLFVGDCVTVNLAIDIMTGCILKLRNDKKISVNIEDLNYKNVFEDIRGLLSCQDQQLILLKFIIEYFHPNFGFDIQTFSKSPVGGGLGGSSSLCISIIKAFHKKLGIIMTEHDTVELAHNLEAKVIKSPTGTQDYYPALMGGLNIIHYSSAGIRIEPLNVDLEIFKKNMMLIYTGKSHHSGINNWQVIKSVIEGDSTTLSALKEIAKISADTAEACRNKNWALLPQLFRSEFDSRIKLTTSFSSPEIEKLKKLVVNEGAEAVKICGAGGGGCVLVWADSSKHEGIATACQKNGFQNLKIKPVAQI